MLLYITTHYYMTSSNYLVILHISSLPESFIWQSYSDTIGLHAAAMFSKVMC